MESLGLNRGFWRGRRVFVTGHTGFKGSWLLLMLRQLGAQTSGYALPPPTDPSMFHLLGLEKSCAHRIGDVRDLNALRAAVAEAKPEVVIHMAAQPLVRASYQEPVETYAVNVMGTVNLLEACRSTGSIRSVVVVTTDKCYENLGWTWGYRENDRLGGADPYSNSKAGAELVVDAYRRSFFSEGQSGTAIASARAGNVIGGGDFALDRLIPDAARAFAAGDKLSVRNPLAVRPWQHVLEPLAGYLLLAERLAGESALAQAWNFGPRTDESAPVAQVVEKFADLWGGEAGWIQDPAEHPHEAATLKLDSTKARIELGWTPRLTLEDALRLSAEWYLAYDRREPLDSLTDRQITGYAE